MTTEIDTAIPEPTFTGLTIHWQAFGTVGAFLGVMWMLSIWQDAESTFYRELLSPVSMLMLSSLGGVLLRRWLARLHASCEVVTTGRFNLFEGGRRIALIVKLVWLAGMALVLFTSHGSDVSQGVLVAMGGWIVLSVMQTAIGWTVRGFLGIPWRHARRQLLLPVRSNCRRARHDHRATPATDVVA